MNSIKENHIYFYYIFPVDQMKKNFWMAKKMEKEQEKYIIKKIDLKEKI